MSSSIIFARTLYWSDLGQVFCSKCFFNLRIDSSVFLFLNSIALVISSPFLFEVCRKLVTFGGLCLEGFLLSFLFVAVAASSVLCRCSSCDAGGLVQPYPRPTDDTLVFLVELAELLLHCRYLHCKDYNLHVLCCLTTCLSV